jgi:hypothetical protein
MHEGSGAEAVRQIGTTRSKHSSLIDRTNRSAYSFQFGARGGERTIRTPGRVKPLLDPAATTWDRGRKAELAHPEAILTRPQPPAAGVE